MTISIRELTQGDIEKVSGGVSVGEGIAAIGVVAAGAGLAIVAPVAGGAIIAGVIGATTIDIVSNS